MRRLPRRRHPDRAAAVRQSGGAPLIQFTAEAVGASEPDLSGLAAGRAPRYSGHSLRAGLAEAEAQLHDVMRQTRHSSVEVARCYMRSADLWRNNVTEKVLRRRGE